MLSTPHRLARAALGSRRISWIFAFALAAAFSCASPPPAPAPAADSPAPVRDRLSGYHRFEVGGQKGFVKSIEGPGGERHEVYDQDMKPIGAYTPLGRTIRYRGGDPPEHVGNYLPDDSIRALLGIASRDVPVVRTPMPAPLTMDDMEKKEPAAPADAGAGEGSGSP